MRDARFVSLVLGVWMFVSAFLWPHYGPQEKNSLIVGALLVVASLAAFRVPAFRAVISTVAVWLVFSSIFLPARSVGTFVNNIVVGIAAFFASYSGRYRAPVVRRRQPA